MSTANVLRLLEEQRYRCALTGRPLTPDTASLDHIVPVRCGGEHVVENTQVLHRDVNRAKGTLTNAEFVQLCQEVVQHTAAQFDGQPPGEDSAIRPCENDPRLNDTAMHAVAASQSNESQSLDWYAAGQARDVEVAGVRVTVRFVGRKGRRARIAITGPAGAVFRALDSSKAERSPVRSA